jgi:tRNA nucleotidyltransferase (CCA-adding enzyme)
LEQAWCNGLMQHIPRLRLASAAAHKVLQSFAQTVALNKGQAFFVGGVVRDALLDLDVKDVDIEVYGLPAARVRAVVESHFSPVEEYGAAFGVLHTVVDGIDIDISLPRRDAKIAPGHTGFTVDTDPFLDKKEACGRRDFTVNAMLMDVLTGEIQDFFGCQSDVAKGVLRVVDEQKFAEDPLRVLRGVQLAGRFCLTAEPRTVEVLRRTAGALGELSMDRVREEWRKLFLLGASPMHGLTLAGQVGAFGSSQAMVDAMAATAQEPEWHPEGDVWIHVRMVCQEAMNICLRDGVEGEERLTVLLGALCHDIGKPSVTRFVPEEGRIRSKGHSEAGASLVESFLLSLGFGKYASIVRPLVAYHLEPYKWYAAQGTDQEKTAGDFRKIARALWPATVEQLAWVAEADMVGRGPFPPGSHVKQPEAARWFAKQAEIFGVVRTKPADAILGNELIPLGFKPGPAFKLIIRAANQLQDTHDWNRERILAACARVPSIVSLPNEEEMVRALQQAETL